MHLPLSSPISTQLEKQQRFMQMTLPKIAYCVLALSE